jgi:hypothetical protein
MTELQVKLYELSCYYSWRLNELGGDRPLTSSSLQAELSGGDRPYNLFVLAGHGAGDGLGVHLSDGLWQGEGHLEGLDWLILVSCAVGRLHQFLHRDAKGLFSQLALNGCRCALAAKWPIDAKKAAAFAAEIVRCYLESLAKLPAHCPIPAFTRARALNEARRGFLRNVADPARDPRPHLAAAFELYGFG